MKEDSDGKPKIARNARGLGIRVEGELIDIPSPNGRVRPGTGGMSVAPEWRDLPDHRIPARLQSKGAGFACGNNGDKCWRHGQGAFQSGPFATRLTLQVDGQTHGTVQPEIEMTLKDFESSLAETRDAWVVDEE